MTDEKYLAKLDEIEKLPDDEYLKELAKLPPIDVYENWPDPEPIPDAWKYRVNAYEDDESASNIVDPRFRDLYNPEKVKQYTKEQAAMDALLKRIPTELLRPEKDRIVILLRILSGTVF